MIDEFEPDSCSQNKLMRVLQLEAYVRGCGISESRLAKPNQQGYISNTFQSSPLFHTAMSTYHFHVEINWNHPEIFCLQTRNGKFYHFVRSKFNIDKCACNMVYSIDLDHFLKWILYLPHV